MAKASLYFVIAILFMLTESACKREPREIAPVSAGDYFEYRSTRSDGKREHNDLAKVMILPGPTAKSYMVVSEPEAGVPPVEVDKALEPGKPLQNHLIGQLWLPPALRKDGAQTRQGLVKRSQSWNTWEVWVVQGHLDRAHYYFDVNTGFLVGYQIPTAAGLQSARLQASTIDGL